MTSRTEETQLSPIERAIHDTVDSIHKNAKDFFHHYNVAEAHRITEDHFLRVLALHLVDKELRHWYRDLGVAPPDNGAT
jgi:hypothetical protein